MTAVIYARYSSDNQREESIEGQIRECTAYAEKNGITVVKHYIDRALSAKTDNRPDFQQMIKDSEKRLFDIVLVWKLDRFARTAPEGAMLVRDLVERGIKVNILNMGVADNTPMGKVMVTVMLAFAEYERDMIVERTSMGKAMKREHDPDWREGRKLKEIDNERFEKLAQKQKDGIITVADCCRELGISRSTWYDRVRKVGV